MKESHVIAIISQLSVYNYNKLYFFPLKSNAHPHSLVLKGKQLLFDLHSPNYYNQILQFKLIHSMIPKAFVYTIWKKELIE